MNIDDLYIRSISAMEKNLPLESRSQLWDWCYDHSQEVEMTKENLEQMGTNNLTWGFFNGTPPNETRETLIKFAQSLGIYGLQNPENTYDVFPKVNWQDKSNDEILDLIQEQLPFKITLPEFVGGRENVRTKYGILTDRHIHYLYVLKRIIELFPDKNTSIIEIGAGLGILGYYLDKAGYKDYTIIDLARTNVCQTYFLAKNLPEREIVISSDFSEHNSNMILATMSDAIKILHTSNFNRASLVQYDLMVNMDGLTEYPKEDAQKYFQSDCAKYLLSINHEVNDFRVCELTGRKRLSREKFWLRSGYVTELYRYE